MYSKNLLDKTHLVSRQNNPQMTEQSLRWHSIHDRAVPRQVREINCSGAGKLTMTEWQYAEKLVNETRQNTYKNLN